MNPIKKRALIIILKAIVYVCTLALSYLGAASLTSCAVRRGFINVKATQSGWIIINDTLRLSNTNEMEVGGLGEGVPQHPLYSDNCCYEAR